MTSTVQPLFSYEAEERALLSEEELQAALDAQIVADAGGDVQKESSMRTELAALAAKKETVVINEQGIPKVPVSWFLYVDE